ncbi:hypothetical protein OPQ81_009445 [Rhizoctonia solani]|nr:hypothetical protein OPQ81_009445 [Rhizoctonia solani]
MQETTATPEGTNNLINNTIHPINPDTPRHSYSNLQGSGVTVHNYTLPSIELRVNRVDIFIIHESRVSKFTSLNKLIEDSRHTGSEIDTPVISVRGDSTLASDFRNTFDILDTCLIEPINFSSEVLVSAARISAAYGYPSLRAFCIKQLEGLSLGPIERLQIGRALDLKSWEERTYQELSEREETITEEEMLALGINAYFQVATKSQDGPVEKRLQERVAQRE